MIHLTTGLPGSGKTLRTISYVKALSERESRPVFYSGITDLALPWQEIDPEKWMECPSGSIIVIDECQRLYRPRGNGSKVPDYVSALETHRHAGLDIFLITQHPMLVDSNVRRLTERHWHVSRRFGMQRATVFAFESCKDQPLSRVAGAQREEWKFPKEAYAYYKSAEVHTVKRRIPMQVYLLIVFSLLVGAAVWMFISRHYQDGQIVIPGATPDKKPELVASSVVPSSSSSSRSPVRSGEEKVKHLTRDEYVTAYQPRLAGLPHTAPIYDEVTKPTRAPIPVGAVMFKGTCRAYTSQGTLIAMDQSLCLGILERGWFREFDDKPTQIASVPDPSSSTRKPVL